jgi:hypothetical protein
MCPFHYNEGQPWMWIKGDNTPIVVGEVITGQISSVKNRSIGLYQNGLVDCARGPGTN